MKKQPKKTFNIPIQANTSGEVHVRTGTNSLGTEGSYAGDSVDKHKELEAANAELAEKEISQTFNNS
ncbi:hypothetical protein [Halobacillus naozhouensis]|uniref:Uncharacterized protein n=1 Tax=Halobacillus naozhouensis TaxID=554880 RepID=A0ABY8J405_9BACI|nr:hypothetical protein [Halobacillus naozhouensis]WFT75485.1 hypothetical protein P9989_03545 [Halobacillus naozhouensis]